MKCHFTSEKYSINNESSYFAAANTGDGFKSLFDSIFNTEETKRIYILKGGPGTGKSTLMKKAVGAAQKKGLSTELYYCSSDPDSLDGIIIKDTGVSILDGTAPHVFDPVYPGARDIIVNLGDAWDKNALFQKSDVIKELSSLKSNCYKRAYGFLSVAKKLDSDMAEMGKNCMNMQKIDTAVRRFAEKHLKKAKSGFEKYRICEGISGKGSVRLFTPESTASELYFVRDAKNTAGIFFDMLKNFAKKFGIGYEASLMPLNFDRITGMYFPEKSLCISMYDDNYCAELEKRGKSYRVINLARFFDKGAYKEIRNKYRFCEKCKKAILDQAYRELHEAGELHSNLEALYGQCTDYNAVEGLSNNIIGKITE